MYECAYMNVRRTSEVKGVIFAYKMNLWSKVYAAFFKMKKLNMNKVKLRLLVLLYGFFVVRKYLKTPI